MRAIGADAADLGGIAIVEHPSDGPANDRHPAKPLAFLDADNADAASDGPVVAMVVGNESVGDLQ